MSNTVINDQSWFDIGFPYIPEKRIPNTIIKSYAGNEVAINVMDHDLYSTSIMIPVRTRDEEQAFWSFYDDHLGDYDSFLFLDPKRNFVAKTQIGVGASGVDTFQLKDAKGFDRYEIQESPIDAKIWVDASLQTKSTHYNITYYQSGACVFEPGFIPTPGQIVYAEFYFWRRVRFLTSPQKTSEVSNRNIVIQFKIGEVLP